MKDENRSGCKCNKPYLPVLPYGQIFSDEQFNGIQRPYQTMTQLENELYQKDYTQFGEDYYRYENCKYNTAHHVSTPHSVSADDNGNSILTGDKDTFTCLELEVFQVVY